MKKILLILASFVVLFAACSKEEKKEEQVKVNCNIVTKDFTYTEGSEQEFLNNMLDFYVTAEKTSQVYYSTYEGIQLEDDKVFSISKTNYNLEECISIGQVIKSDKVLKTPEEQNASSIYYHASDDKLTAYETSFDENYTISITDFYEDTENFEDAYESNKLENTMPYLDELIKQVKKASSDEVMFISDHVYYEGEVELKDYGTVTASVFANTTEDILYFRVDKNANTNNEDLDDLEIPTGDALSIYFGEYDSKYLIYHQINLAMSQVQ